MKIGDIFLGLVADDRGFEADVVKKAGKAGDKAGKTLGYRMGESIRKGFGLGAGISAFNLLSGAISATVGFLGDAVKAGMEEEQSIARMTASLKANIPAWDGRTDAIEKVLKAQIDLGFSDDEQRNSMSLLVAATNDVSAALKIQRTAMDLARFKGISLMEATEALTKVEAGSYRILKGLGIVLKDGATQTEALAAVQAAAEGQAAKFAETTGGKLLVAQTKFGEKMDELGQVALPAASTAIDVVTAAFDLLGLVVDGATLPFREFDDAAGDAALTLENNTNAATVGMATWGSYAKSVAQAAGTWREATEATAEGTEELRRVTQITAPTVKTAFGTMKVAAEKFGTVGADAAWKVITAAKKLTTALAAEARAMITGYYEPLILRDNLAAANAEIAAARRVLASGKATAAEKADARSTLITVGQSQAEYILQLAEAGETGNTAYKTGLASLRTAIDAAKGPAKTALQEILDKILAIEKVGAVVPVNVKVRVTGGKAPKPKALGGPVTAGTPYIVGEHRPELFVPESNGYILPRVPPAFESGPASAGSGGNTITIYNPEPRPAPEDIGRVLRRTAALGMG